MLPGHAYRAENESENNAKEGFSQSRPLIVLSDKEMVGQYRKKEKNTDTHCRSAGRCDARSA